MQPKDTLQTKNHSAYRLDYHIVFVIKYRNKVINKQVEERLRDIFTHVLAKWECGLTEFGAESDHVHLLIEAHPSLDLSRLIGNLKAVSARHIRKEFTEHLAPFFWKPYFWARSYAVTSTGGANLETVKQYVLTQERPSD